MFNDTKFSTKSLATFNTPRRLHCPTLERRREAEKAENLPELPWLVNSHYWMEAALNTGCFQNVSLEETNHLSIKEWSLVGIMAFLG